MRNILGLLLSLLFANLVTGQNYYEEFKTYLDAGDTVNQLETLTKWVKADSSNPELFTCYFNYYFRKSIKERVVMSKEKPEGETIQVNDSTGQAAGYIGSEYYVDQNELQKGFDIIQKGIDLYPDRLDMRFGKIYAYGQQRDWEHFTRNIIESVKHSNVNHNNWLWTNNETQPNGKEFFLTSIQDYQIQLYNTGNDSLLKYMRAIANEILNLYPDDIMSLSNLSITYTLTGEYETAIDYLLKAEKLDPQDYIVLANLAYAYKLNGDKEKAIEYYEKTIQVADEDTIEYAKQQIEELKK
jgi:tetratricopeptide (TPR) repeat protein